MYRIIDVKRMFVSLYEQKYRFSCNYNNILNNVHIKLVVKDTLIHNNNHPVTIHCVDGIAKVVEEGSYGDVHARDIIEIHTEISTFTAVIMGTLTFKKAVEFGLASLVIIADNKSPNKYTQRYASSISNFFSVEAPPVCMSVF